MSSLLHDLENNEAILLMYLADELPSDDRAEVEEMLAIDAGMRAELEQLRETLGTFEAALGHLDLVEPVSSKRTAALRRVGSAMAQWQVDRLAGQPKPEPSKVIRHPWWIYSASAAAVVAIGLLVWWGFLGEPSSSMKPTDLASKYRDARGMPFGPEVTPWSGDGAISRWMMGVAPTRPGDGEFGGDDALDEVERQVVALSNESSNRITYFGAPPNAVEAGTPNE